MVVGMRKAEIAAVPARRQTGLRADHYRRCGGVGPGILLQPLRLV